MTKPKANPQPNRFKKGNPGKPKGAKDRRRVFGTQAAKALEAGAWDVVEGLLASPNWRARDAAAKTILGYAIGLPRQAVDLVGFGDLAVELATALKAARERALSAPAALPLPALPGDRPIVNAVLVTEEIAAHAASSQADAAPVPPVSEEQSS